MSNLEIPRQEIKVDDTNLDDDEFYCDEPRPQGFTYYPNVTVCDTCHLKFPYYDCYCELKHTCETR